MSMESDLKDWLLAQSGVAAVLGTRVYRLVADQSAERPYAVMVTLNVDPQRSLNGPTGEAIARIQITCWADSAEDADNARDAMRTALRSLESSLLGMPQTIGSTRLRDVSDETDQELYEDDIRQPRRMLEITIRYEE